MTVNPIIKIIRAKKFGILMRDARQKSGRNLGECAQVMGITEDELAAMEAGERPPTLPELEIFAYFLEIPLEHFWGNEVLPANGNVSVPDPAEVKQLRQNAIGELIKKARADAALSVDELAGLAGIQSQDLDAYESGASAIPLPELEILTRTLNSSMSNFENQEGTVGGWFTQQRSMREFLSLSKELQDFVGKPINKPYLELAKKISELKTERLRALAEGLLEITY